MTALPFPARSLAQRWARSCFPVAAAIGMLAPASVAAQNVSTIVSPAIAPDYARDRNISVTERARPDFDALGIRLGGFLAFPSITASSAVTNNAYLDNTIKTGDVYAVINPALRVQSDWNNHRLVFEATGDFRRYAQETLRNQNGYLLGTSGRLDVTREVAINADAQISRSYENPFTDDVTSNVTVLSNYIRKSVLLRTSYAAGRIRVTGSADFLGFRFNTLEFADGTARSQAFRNRDAYRAGVLAEYALSPTVSYFTQINIDKTNYITSLNGLDNRDSTGVLAIAGTSFDIPGTMRGSIGLGYTWRNYKAARFADKNGVSVQAKADFFLSPITTLGVTAQRVLQDASIGNGAVFIDTRASVQVDHELLENLLLNARLSFVRQRYPDTGRFSDVIGASAGARFQMTRSLGFSANLAYGEANPNGVGLGREFNEWRGLLSVTFRR